MKLLENDNIYIQAKDLAILFNTDNAIPFSVFGITLSNHNWAKKKDMILILLFLTKVLLLILMNSIGLSILIRLWI